MTISYKWLLEYLPKDIAVPEPKELSNILTAIGLEVESLELYEQVKGGLNGIVIGKVLSCEQHPNADKLKITTVDIGAPAPVQIVCGAANVAAGQTVPVATVGAVLYPSSGEAITIKNAKIRGVESAGMICAEDEIGWGTSHEGIMVLPDTLIPGTPAADYFKPYTDWIFEIGLTPNHMDAMCHYGVARDVCAYLSFHQTETKAWKPVAEHFAEQTTECPITVTVEQTDDCLRYAGICIKNVTVGASPQWLKNKLLSIGQRSINNIVDITNFILHESGQPLHAFDMDAISGSAIIVKRLPAGTTFITLDEKERKLNGNELMICNATEGMCMAGVFGGIKSGVTAGTKNIFLESAWFNPVSIRKTSVAHGLRTDAATRFEKGVDISGTVTVLQRAAEMICKLAGGTIEGKITDVYPKPVEPVTVTIQYSYLHKLSGKRYAAADVKKILQSLGFVVVADHDQYLTVKVPLHKTDISIPADIVEEILRIDGLDRVEMPGTVQLTPAVEQSGDKESLKEKMAGLLVGFGCIEILTNSITNSNYFSADTLAHTVKMVNSLSAELNVMRPSMLETGLEVIAYNINRKNTSLQLFELGKIYTAQDDGKYTEHERFSIYLTGNYREPGWRSPSALHDVFSTKGMVMALLTACGLTSIRMEATTAGMQIVCGNQSLGTIIEVDKKHLQLFDIKQPVFFVDLDFQALLQVVQSNKIRYSEVPKFPFVQRDLSLVVDATVRYAEMEAVVAGLKMSRLHAMKLFDVFESDKLGKGKKSMAISFTLGDAEKTLTDKETDQMMNKMVAAFEKELGAVIRK